MRQSGVLSVSAWRAVTPASSQTAADTMATHRTPPIAKTTITAIGAKAKIPSDSQRTMPRRDRKK